MMRRRFFWLAFACVPFLLAINRGGPPANGDERAWRDLVAITETDKVTGSESPVGWRFWVTKNELFQPAPGDPAPTEYRASNYQASKYRPIACNGSSLKAALKSQGNDTISVPDDDKLCEEIFLNPCFAQTVIDNSLYQRENLLSFVFKENGFHFDPRVRAIKTEWAPINPAEKSDYFVAVRGNELYGLVALHLRSHDSLWATWIHQSRLQELSGYSITDSFGRTCTGSLTKRLKKLLREHRQETWLKYRLIGTQVSFMNRKFLGNPDIEKSRFRTVSCISCHDQARVTRDGINHRIDPDLVGTAAPLDPSFASTDFSMTLMLAAQCLHLTRNGCANGNACKDCLPQQ